MKTFLFFYTCFFFAKPLIASTSYDLESYEVKLTPFFDKKELEVDLKITFQVTESNNKFIFPIEEVTIKSVDIESQKFNWIIKSKKMILSLKNQIKKGERLTVNILYTGKPKGIVFSNSVVFADYDSCKWLLCNDDSGDKFYADFYIKAPVGWKVIANGKEIEFKNGFYRWGAERSFPGYLFGFVIGKLEKEERQNLSKSFFIFGNNLSQNQLNKIFQKTFSATKFFKDKSGIDLPTNTYTQVILPGYIAQEKSTFSLLGLKYLDPMFSDPTEDWLIVHELAHQWWGNSIICANWDHFWLNEGLTTFMVASYKKHQWGESQYEREISLAKRRYQIAIDNNFDVPLTYSGTYPSLKIKRAIVYSKGFLFLEALKQYMGDVDFWAGIKEYSNEYKDKTVTSKNFQIKMQKMSDKKLEGIFNDWVY